MLRPKNLIKLFTTKRDSSKNIFQLNYALIASIRTNGISAFSSQVRSTHNSLSLFCTLYTSGGLQEKNVYPSKMGIYGFYREIFAVFVVRISGFHASISIIQMKVSDEVESRQNIPRLIGKVATGTPTHT